MENSLPPSRDVVLPLVCRFDRSSGAAEASSPHPRTLRAVVRALEMCIVATVRSVAG